MISAKLRNIIWSLVILHLAIGVAPAWGQYLTTLKSGQKGIFYGVQSSTGVMLYVDGQKRHVLASELTQPIGFRRIGTTHDDIRAGKLTAICYGDWPYIAFRIHGNGMSIAARVPPEAPNETISHSRDSFGARIKDDNTLFFQTDSNTIVFIRESSELYISSPDNYICDNYFPNILDEKLETAATHEATLFTKGKCISPAVTMNRLTATFPKMIGMRPDETMSWTPAKPSFLSRVGRKYTAHQSLSH